MANKNCIITTLATLELTALSNKDRVMYETDTFKDIEYHTEELTYMTHRRYFTDATPDEIIRQIQNISLELILLETYNVNDKITLSWSKGKTTALNNVKKLFNFYLKELKKREELH